MLTNKLRPKTWEDVVGQDGNVEILKAIVREPEKAPRTLILAGTFGSGKSSCAKIFTRALNNITDANYDLYSSPYYLEFDSNQFGNVKDIRRIRDNFYGFSSNQEGWRVIVLDEFHRTSTEAQNAILFDLEEVQGRLFFVICTTEIKRLIPTVRSRALELFFNKVRPEVIIEHLGKLENDLKIDIPEVIKRNIAYRSNGHMRNVHMLLDKYLLVGKDGLLEHSLSGITLLSRFFHAVFENNYSAAIDNLNKLCLLPLEEIKNEFEEFILLGAKLIAGGKVNNEDINNLLS